LHLATTQSALEVLIGSLLKQLGVLQSLNKLKLFALHALNHCLMLDALVLLPKHLVLNLLLGAHLSLHQVALPLVKGFSLLTLDHLLQRIVPYNLLVLLYLHEVFLLTLLHLKVVYIAFDFILKVSLRCINIHSDCLLSITVLLLPMVLFFLFLSVTFLSLSCNFQVTLACAEDIVGALFSFVEFFPCLNYESELTVSSLACWRI